MSYKRLVTREEIAKWAKDNAWPVDRIPDMVTTLNDIYDVVGDHVIGIGMLKREGKTVSRRRVEFSLPEAILYIIMALESESDWRRETRREAESVVKQEWETHDCREKPDPSWGSLSRNRGGTDDHPWVLELGVEHVEVTTCPYCGKRLPPLPGPTENDTAQE